MGPRECIAFLRQMAEEIRGDGKRSDDPVTLNAVVEDAYMLETCAAEIESSSAFISSQEQRMKAARKMLRGRR